MNSSQTSVAGSSHGTASTAATATTTRRFVRVAGGPSPFVWRGLLPLMGLSAVLWFALAPFASRDIEATVAREVQGQLDRKEMRWVQVAVSGQEVLLSGAPPNASAGDQALAVARAATCPTWAGPLTCAVTVVGAFGAIAAPAMPALPAAPVSPATAVASAAASALPSAPVVAAAQACEAAFAKLLSTARIEFVTGSARIGAASGPLLDQLAEAAKGCPGKISIEGHTDDVGDDASNLRLSEARAQSVVAALTLRGIAIDRLQAVGHGESRPFAANDNEAGRAANRRIEFKALP